MMLPPSLQSSLPAGRLVFTGRELNPLDRYKRFQITFSSSFSGFVLAQGKFHFELSLSGALFPQSPRRRGRLWAPLVAARYCQIISSARASSIGGTVSPSALAVFRLITISNLVGACRGRSPGLVPFKIRST